MTVLDARAHALRDLFSLRVRWGLGLLTGLCSGPLLNRQNAV